MLQKVVYTKSLFFLRVFSWSGVNGIHVCKVTINYHLGKVLCMVHNIYRVSQEDWGCLQLHHGHLGPHWSGCHQISMKPLASVTDLCHQVLDRTSKSSPIFTIAEYIHRKSSDIHLPHLVSLASSIGINSFSGCVAGSGKRLNVLN